jgi:hypothetical protein
MRSGIGARKFEFVEMKKLRRLKEPCAAGASVCERACPSLSAATKH